jgi:hypothetical protein
MVAQAFLPVWILKRFNAFPGSLQPVLIVQAWYHEDIETAPIYSTRRSGNKLPQQQYLTGNFPFARPLVLCYDGLASRIATAKLFRKIPKNGVDDTSE